MANLARFKELLAARVDAQHTLPPVVLKQNTEIGNAFGRVVTLDNRLEDETDGQMVDRYVVEICDSLNEEVNKDAGDSLDQAIELFSGKFRQALADIDSIREIAKQLATDTENEVAKYLATNKYVSENTKFLTLSEDFPVFTWEGAKTIGWTAYVIETVNSIGLATDVEPKKEIDQARLNFVCSILESEIKVNLVEIEDEARTVLVENAKEVCGDLSAEAVTEVMNYILGRDSFDRVFVALQKQETASASENFERVKMFDEFILKTYPVCDAAITDQLALPEDKKDEIKKNAEAIAKFCTICAYYEIMMRTTMFSDRIVLSGGVINGDVKDQFEADGGTNLMIANYIRRFYNDERSQIPMVGIRPSTIIESASDVAIAVAADIAKIRARIQIETVNANESCFVRVARDYAMKKYSREFPEATAEQVTIFTSDTYKTIIKDIATNIRQYDICFVDAAIAFIIALDYAGTFVEHLQKSLGAAYVAKAELNSNITAADIKVTDMHVIAKLVATWVADKLITVQTNEVVVA